MHSKSTLRHRSLNGLAFFYFFTWLAVLSSPQVNLFSLTNTAYAAEPAAFSNWAKTAKLGGAALFTGMTPQEIDQVLSDMVAQRVTVIEADSDLSNYMTEAQFEQELALMRNFAAAAHVRGIRVVWYYPALEVVTVNGKNIEQTMAKEHPDWVQIGLDGTPNVFYGGSGQVFWVAKNDESAWMSPSSPGYRNFFLDRVRRIAATGIDGLWVDVPLYADFGPTKWSDFNPDAVARFEADTGFTIPVTEDWDDPAWRRWIAWRHEEIARFLSDVTVAARSVDPEFPVIAETLPTDYNGATLYGLDGGYLKHIEGLTHVWETDTMSNNVGMRNAREDDWISFISAFKYTRAASGKKPSWVFNYGKQVDDAGLVMAQALATGNNPYELQVPEMTTTVGVDFRTRMFGWAQENSPYLFEAQTGARVAVLYSSPSRDYVDKFEGLGMFATWQAGGDSLWWAGDPVDSAYERQYLAEYRGMVKMLVHEHIPFDSIVNPADSSELIPYDTVILPDIQAISDAEAEILRQYVQNGGNLIVTGSNPTGLDEYGTARSDYALADLLGFNKSSPLPGESQNAFGAGNVLFYSALLGKDYFVSSNASALQNLSDAIQATSTIPLTTDADRRIHFELSHLGNETVVQFVNFIGVDGTFSTESTTFSVNLDIPAGKQVTSVALTSPDLPNTPALSPLDYTVSNQQISFDVALDQYALVVISYDGAQKPSSNHTPIASRDSLNTDVNSPLNFTHAMLLANDGDLDGNTLVVTTVDAANASGSLANQEGGGYTYTPLQDFVGVDTLTYAISDGYGGTDSGIISIHVAPPASTYFPASVTITTGTFDYGTLASFEAVDADTYDIKSAAVSGGRGTDWYATTTISESPDNIAQIKVTHIGQYSKAGVEQNFYVYNFQDEIWELADTSVVGNEDDFPVSKVIDAEVAKYISAQGELRVRVTGFKAANGLVSWSNALSWEVSQTVGGGGGGGTPNAPPVAAFTVDCAALVCNFTDGSTDSDGSVAGWNWDFEGSASSSQQNPSHTYTVAGIYPVSLTVTDNKGATNTVSQNVTVSNPPPANQDPTAAFTVVCVGLTCNFTDASSDSDGSVAGWNWSFEGSASSSQQNPSHTYVTAGTYTVSLTVIDDDGATNSTSQSVAVTAGTNEPVEAIFVSIANEDGWVRESDENSNVGGARNTGGGGARAIRMGDHHGDQQYKAILSFDTSSIPAGATITAARLELTRGSNRGKNPFNTHGTHYVDIKSGGFSGSNALENSDFQAPADGVQVAIVTNQGGSGTVYHVDLSDDAFNYISKVDRTQLRLYFALDDNDDQGADFAGFYSANNNNPARHPRLIVTYQE